MNYLRFVTTLTLCLLAAVAQADSEAMPTPKVFSSPHGFCYFKLVPASDFDEAKSEGAMYRVADGEDELLYESNGWYSFNVLISDDGSFIARRGPWPRYQSPPTTTEAIVFYLDGAPVRTYTVSDLIADQTKLQRSISHYSWGGALRWSYEDGANIIRVNTVEDKVIKFNIRTAEIVD